VIGLNYIIRITPSSAASGQRWAAHVQQIFEVDPRVWPQCAGAMRIVEIDRGAIDSPFQLDLLPTQRSDIPSGDFGASPHAACATQPM